MCGLDAARVARLEAENKDLRAQLQALNGKLQSMPNDVQHNDASTSCGSFKSSSSHGLHTTTSHERSNTPSFQKLHAVVRGYTAAGLAEVLAAEESQCNELEVAVSDAPRYFDGADGACTVVRVRTIDAPGVLASVSTVLAGGDLTIARAAFHSSAQGVVSFEFWVQQTNSDGKGPVLEGVRRRAIEQRVRHWSAGQSLTISADGEPLPFAAFLASSDLSELLKLPGWHSAVELPQRRADEGSVAHDTDGGSEALVNALTDALSANCTWTGALPPVLARQTASALLPRMCRMRLAAGATINRNRPEQLGTDFLLLLEDAMPVLCGLPSHEEHGSTMPIGHEACTLVEHPAGSTLCLSSSIEVSGRQLAWHSLSAPSGGVVAVIGRATLRELLGETRKAAVRSHAKLLANAPYFAPLSTPQLLALCHRAVEVEAVPGSCIQTAQGVDAQTSTATPVFMIVLRGSAIVTYTPPPGTPAANAPGLVNGSLVLHRLRPNDHYGALGVLRDRVEEGLELHAGEEGCTLLSWVSDECARPQVSNSRHARRVSV